MQFLRRIYAGIFVQGHALQLPVQLRSLGFQSGIQLAGKLRVDKPLSQSISEGTDWFSL